MFLTATNGPIVVGIGLAVVAFSPIFGSREGLSKATATLTTWGWATHAPSEPSF